MTYIYLTYDYKNSYYIFNLNIENLKKISKFTNLKIVNDSFITFNKQELSNYNKLFNNNGYICKINNMSKI